MVIGLSAFQGGIIERSVCFNNSTRALGPRISIPRFHLKGDREKDDPEYGFNWSKKHENDICADITMYLRWPTRDMLQIKELLQIK